MVQLIYDLPYIAYPVGVVFATEFVGAVGLDRCLGSELRPPRQKCCVRMIGTRRPATPVVNSHGVLDGRFQGYGPTRPLTGLPSPQQLAIPSRTREIVESRGRNDLDRKASPLWGGGL